MTGAGLLGGKKRGGGSHYTLMGVITRGGVYSCCDAGDAGDVGAGDADDVDDVDADDADDVGDVDVSDANDVSHSKRGSGRVWAARAGAGGRWAGGAGRVVGFKSVLGMNHNSALPLVQVPMPTQLLVSIFCLPGSRRQAEAEAVQWKNKGEGSGCRK